jgi:hypothetical protein
MSPVVATYHRTEIEYKTTPKLGSPIIQSRAREGNRGSDCPEGVTSLLPSDTVRFPPYGRNSWRADDDQSNNAAPKLNDPMAIEMRSAPSAEISSRLEGFCRDRRCRIELEIWGL